MPCFKYSAVRISRLLRGSTLWLWASPNGGTTKPPFRSMVRSTSAGRRKERTPSTAYAVFLSNDRPLNHFPFAKAIVLGGCGAALTADQQHANKTPSSSRPKRPLELVLGT